MILWFAFAAPHEFSVVEYYGYDPRFRFRAPCNDERAIDRPVFLFDFEFDDDSSELYGSASISGPTPVRTASTQGNPVSFAASARYWFAASALSRDVLMLMPMQQAPGLVSEAASS